MNEDDFDPGPPDDAIVRHGDAPSAGGEERVEARMPPHDMEAEGAVISATLLDPEAVPVVVDVLEPKHFYSEAHRRIWEVVILLHAEQAPVDVVQVATRLRDSGRLQQVGGMAYLTQVLNAAPAVANVGAYARTVFHAWRARETIAVCAFFEAAGYARTIPSAELALRASDALITIAQARGSEQSGRHVYEWVRDCYDQIAQSAERGCPPGTPSGFYELDDLTGGFQRQEMTLVAARPGMGKTAFVISLLLNVCERVPPLIAERKDEQPPKGYGVYFYSAEMPGIQIALRMLANRAKVNLTTLRSGRLDAGDWGPLTDAAERLGNLHLIIDDEPGLHVRQVAARVRHHRRLFAAQGVDMVVFAADYLQLLKGHGPTVRNEEQEVAAISGTLLQTAKENDMHAIAAAQLNRDVETRANKRPMLSDLRSSGRLEQDANNIVFLYRPERYGEKVAQDDHGLTEADLAKQRNGPTGIAKVRYRGVYTRFENM